MLEQVRYSVTVPVPRVLACRAFCDLKRLLHRNIYAEAVWAEGAPWRVGSRARYVVLKPMAAVIASVVTSCDPPRSLTVLNHGLGVTAEQQVMFLPVSTDSTKVEITLEAFGNSREISETEVQRGIEFLVQDALDTIVPICEKFASRLVES